MQQFDRHEVGMLDDFEHFRERKFNYLYVCRNCARSFDTVSEVQQCKFCDSDNMQLISSKNKSEKSRPSYRYYCPACEKNFVSHSKIKNCEFCGSRHIHLYEWENGKRDVFRTHMHRFFNSFLKKYDGMGSREKPKTERKFDLDFLKNVKKPEFRFSFFSRRNEEELPSR